MVKKAKVVLVKWVDNNCKIFDGVEQRINKKHIIDENPTFLQKITIKWNRKIWRAIYMEPTTSQPVAKKKLSKTNSQNTTGKKSKILSFASPNSQINLDVSLTGPDKSAIKHTICFEKQSNVLHTTTPLIPSIQKETSKKYCSPPKGNKSPKRKRTCEKKDVDIHSLSSITYVPKSSESKRSKKVQAENLSLSTVSSITNIPNSLESICSETEMTYNHRLSPISSKTNVTNSSDRMISNMLQIEKRSLSTTSSISDVNSSEISDSMGSNMKLAKNQSLSTTSSSTFIPNSSESKRSNTVLISSHSLSPTSSTTFVPNSSQNERSNRILTCNQSLTTTSTLTCAPNCSESLCSYMVQKDNHNLATDSSITYAPTVYAQSNQLDSKAICFTSCSTDKASNMLNHDGNSTDSQISSPTITKCRSKEGSVCHETNSTSTRPSIMQIEEHATQTAFSFPYVVDAQSSFDENCAWHNYQNQSFVNINNNLRKSPRRTSHPSVTMIGTKNTNFGNETPSLGTNANLKKSPRNMMLTKNTPTAPETTNNYLGIESPSIIKQQKTITTDGNNPATSFSPCVFEQQSPGLDNSAHFHNQSFNSNNSLRRSPRRMKSPFSSTPAKTQSYENMFTTNPNESELDNWYYTPPTPAMTYKEILNFSPRRSPRRSPRNLSSPLEYTCNTNNQMIQQSNKNSRTKLIFEDTSTDDAFNDDQSDIYTVLDEDSETKINHVIDSLIWTDKPPENGGPVLARKILTVLVNEKTLIDSSVKGKTCRPINKNILLRIKGAVRQVYGKRRRGRIEFEALWTKCLTSIGHMCKTLRAKQVKKDIDNTKVSITNE